MGTEQIIKLQAMEQEIGELNQQLQLIEQSISELQLLMQSLEEIDETKGNEILVDLGRRIYLPVEIKEKKLTLDVGSKLFVKKTIPEINKTIEEDLIKLITAKREVIERMRSLQGEVEFLINEFEQERDKKENKMSKK
jgi:prefoldin alpha subunit